MAPQESVGGLGCPLGQIRCRRHQLHCSPIHPIASHVTTWTAGDRTHDPSKNPYTATENSYKRIGEVEGKISQLKDDIKNSVTKEEVDQALISQMDKFTEKNKPESFTDIIKEKLEVQEVKWIEAVKNG